MSTTTRRNPPTIGPDTTFTMPGVSRARLANGLQVRSIERRRLPMVSVLLLLPAGSSIDPAGQAGLASLTADMLDEGAAGLSAIELQEAFGRLGTSLETDAGADAVWLSLSVMPSHLPAACDLLFECAGRPALDASDFDRVRTLRLNRLRQLRNSPGALADHAFQHAIFGTHPYGYPSYGVSRAIETLAVEDVRQLHGRVWSPSQATLIVVGAINSAEACHTAERASAWWAAVSTDGDRPAGVRVAATPARPSSPQILLVDRPGSAQTELRIGHVGPSRHTPDYHALVLLNAVLGGQFVSRLNMNLRERMACTYGAHSSFELRRAGGAFVLQTSVQTEATAAAVRESVGEIRSIGSDRPPTADEIAFCAASLTRGYARGYETTGQLARALAQLAAYDLPDDEFDRFVPGIRALDAHDLVTAAAAHLEPPALCVVCVGDRQRIEPGLAALDLGVPIITEVEI